MSYVSIQYTGNARSFLDTGSVEDMVVGLNDSELLNTDLTFSEDHGCDVLMTNMYRLIQEAMHWPGGCAAYACFDCNKLEFFGGNPDGCSPCEDHSALWIKVVEDIPIKKPYEPRDPESWTADLELTYPETWHMHHTGGGCMVATTDNVVVAGEHRYLAISSDCVCIYTDRFDDTWLENHLSCWEFGDNPAVLMNHIEEFFGGSALWNPGRLFLDIMTICLKAL